MSHRLKNEELLREIEEKRQIFQIYGASGRQLDFGQVFGNSNPVVMEIGIGRGEFLVGQSLLDWKRNYLGIDINRERINFTLRQLQTERHSNVRVLDLYVDEKVINIIPEGSIRKVFIIHPDPWPKRRHHGRRLIRHEFINVLYRILDERGVVEIQTDHREYAKWILQHFQERQDFMPIYGGCSEIPRHGHIVTYFEEKKLREGNKPVYITYKKLQQYQ